MHFIWLIIFGLLGYLDFRNKSIPDFITASVWGVFALFCSIFPELCLVAIVSFSLLYLGNVAFLWVFGVQPFGWVDILIIPIFMSIVAQNQGIIIASLLLCFALVLVAMVARHKKETIGLEVIKPINTEETEPFLSYLFISYLVSFFL